MKVFVILLLFCGCSFAENLINEDEVTYLFKKFAKSNLTEHENNLFQDVIDVLYRQERASARELDFYGQARISLDCVICRSAIAALFDMVQEDQPTEDIISVVSVLCTIIGIQSEEVCRGAVELNLPILTYIIKNQPEATPAAMCGLVEQNALVPGNSLCPFDSAPFEWQVDLPPALSYVPERITDERPLNVVVMTDFHIDPLYEAYGHADCDAPTCCRKGQNPAPRFTSTFDDEPLLNQTVVRHGGKINVDLDMAPTLRDMRSMPQMRSQRQSPPAGYWGDYRNCDTPVWAFDDAIDRIVETHKDIDLVYYIGDTIDHFAWETTYDQINEVNQYVVEKLKKSFGHIPILPVIGNHESQPTNQFAPTSVTGPLNTTWLYEALALKWQQWLPQDAYDSFKKRGEYSVLVRPGLRVIIINTNVAYKYNWWIVYDPLDAKEHMDWVVSELYKAEQAGESVHILSHIPPGVSDLTYTWTREYNRVINRFSSIIKAEFNGHTHSDEFKIFYNPEGQPINVAWGAGSVTTYTFYNLNYKIVTFGETYEPRDMVNYVYNLTEANLTPHRRPHWFQLYDMKNTFNMPDLSPTSVNSLVYRMVSTDRHLLDIYAAFFSKLSDERMMYCNWNCKIDNICKTVVTVLWERQKCEELTALYLVNNLG